MAGTQPGANAEPCSMHSIGVRTDHLAADSRTQGPPSLNGYRALDEPDRAIPEPDVAAAWVLTVGIGDLTMIGKITGTAAATPIAAAAAEAPRVLVRARRHDRIEERHGLGTPAPPIAAVTTQSRAAVRARRCDRPPACIAVRQ